MRVVALLELDHFGLAVHARNGLEATDDDLRVADDPLELQEEVIITKQFFGRHDCTPWR